MDLSTEIRVARARTKIRQRKVAEELGISLSAYNKYVENSEKLIDNVRLKTLIMLCKIFDQEFRDKITNYFLTSIEE